MQHILPLRFTYDFGAPVWRIRLDTAARRLALEVRDADLLLAHFYTLQTETLALQQLPVPSGKAWWQGLEDAQHGHVYLHGYGDRKLGQHKGITALEAATLAVAWDEPGLAFYGMAEEGVLAYTADAPEAAFQELQAATGACLRTDLTQQEAAEAVARYSAARFRQAVYPVLYLEGEDYFTQVQQFLESRQLHGAALAIEYAETGEAIIISSYWRTPGGSYQNCIVVFDHTGSLCLKAVLADGLTGIGSDTFFIFMDDLYFLKDKAHLEVYRLLAC
ncbi:DUF4905 domain-containing protein [Pontibacter sp. E15-1]|uniref:DUF4905 domain-containing protein n=1 Tax=Pontibacter sp. E15-1 TaxID=2919918 RepID=UPI001F5014A1|nr:DUF4905 domain-containing protein [Pontibacter sp. E15-1]MCJ8163346.1 DUF4905 domain-containing protein [Pontibacter sp. E15-1]